MRISLILLVLALFGLLALQAAEKNGVNSSRGQEEVSGALVQDTVSDFAAGTMEGTQVTTQGDGEVRLAQDGEGKHLAQGTYTSEVLQAPWLFNALGSNWEGSLPEGTSLTLEVRASSDGSNWTGWLTFEEDNDVAHEEEEAVGALIMVAESLYLQYRLTFSTTDGALSPEVEGVWMFYIASQTGPTVEEARAFVLPRVAGPGAAQPAIISRQGWGAREDLVTLVPQYQTPVKIFVHHTVTPTFPTDPAAYVRAIFYYHARTRGWGDMGYNYLIDWQGNIYEGRRGGEGVVGRHVKEYSPGSIGIALMGDFSQTEVPAAMEESLVKLITWLVDRWGIDPRGRSFFIDVDIPNIAGHRDVLHSSCPGNEGYNILPRVREKVWQSLLEADPRLEFSVAEGFLGQAVTIAAASPSLTTANIQIFLDDVLVAEGEKTAGWAWDTTQTTDGEHTLRAVVTSLSGRTTEIVRKVIVDNNPPLGSFTLGAGTGFVSQLTVALTLEAQDEGSGVAKMRFLSGEEPDPWEDFALQKEWTFDGEEGEKQLSVQFQDAAGHESEVYRDTVLLDMTPPGGWSEEITVEEGEVWVTVADALSGMDPESASYSLSPSGEEWSEWQPAFMAEGEGGTFSVQAPLWPWGGWIRFRAMDLAGNESISPSYALPAPPEPISLPDLVVESVVVEPAPSSAEEPLIVSAVIRNQGTLPASGFWVELLLDAAGAPGSEDATFWADQGIRWHIPALEAGGTVTLTTQEAEGGLGLLSPGKHTLYLVVDPPGVDDPWGLVEEGNEINNLYGPLEFEFQPAQDLAWLAQLWDRIWQQLSLWFSNLRFWGESHG